MLETPASSARTMPSATATITEPMLDTLIGRLHDVRVQVPGRLVFTTSFGREDQAILHAIVAASLDVALVTLDTGRLFPETYDLWAETEARYGVRIRAVYPDAEALATYVGSHGINGFRDAKELRLACCHIRKVAPLATALDGAEGWITGLRSGRTEGEIVPLIARDEARGMWKAAPLADWSVEEVIEFCARHDVPVNALHAAGFPSIGCAPCTRAVLPGEPERAGRWWWESDDQRECGLHLGPDGRLVRSRPS